MEEAAGRASRFRGSLEAAPQLQQLQQQQQQQQQQAQRTPGSSEKATVLRYQTKIKRVQVRRDRGVTD